MNTGQQIAIAKQRGIIVTNNDRGSSADLFDLLAEGLDVGYIAGTRVGTVKLATLGLGTAGPYGLANASAGLFTQPSDISQPISITRFLRPPTSATTSPMSPRTLSSWEMQSTNTFRTFPAARASHSPQLAWKLTTVDLLPGESSVFEAGLRAEQPALHDETLWYRIVAGGPTSRYIRLRPRATFSAALDGSEPSLPDKFNALIKTDTVEILNLRPLLSYGLPPLR